MTRFGTNWLQGYPEIKSSQATFTLLFSPPFPLLFPSDLDYRSVYRLYRKIPGSLTPEFQVRGDGLAIPATPSPEFKKMITIHDSIR